MDYAGYYINLDRNPERRAEIEAELARHGLGGAYSRFPASDGNTLGFPNPGLKEGEMGCFTSHYLLLKENLDQNRHLHVIEDDILLAGCMEQAVRWTFAQDFMDKYDIIFTDIFVPLLNDACKVYKQFYDKTVTRDDAGNITRVVFSVLDMKDITFASTCSFLVNKNSVRKLHDLYENELARGPSMPLDLFIREKSREGAIRVGCLFPFVTSIRLDRILTSNIGLPEDQQSLLAINIVRYLFFVGCDFNLCRKYIREYLPVPANDPQVEILSRLLAFSLTDAYRAP